MSDPNEGQVSNKETTNVAEENEEEEKKFDDINVTTATTSVAASMTTASTMMPMTGWIDNNNNNHHYEDDGHTWSRSQPASPSSSRLGDYYNDEPVAKKGKRDVYRNSKLNNNGTTTATTTTTTTSSSSFLRSPPRPHLFGGGAAAGSSQSSQVLSPSLLAMSASTGTTENVTNTSSTHHSLCLSPSVSATVSATAGTTGPTGGTGSAAATSPSSTTTMMMTTTSFSEPPSGWEAIWERFMTTNDQSRQLLRQWVSLPTIAVLGDTSSGKSSLLSQLSGLVELPSSHELTTKCPTELQMRYSSNRQATIDIHWDRQQQQIMTTTTTTTMTQTSSQQQQQRNNNNNNLRRARKLLWEQRVLRTPEEWKQIPNILLQAQQVILKEQERNDLQSQQHPSVERDNNRSNHNNKNNNKNTSTAASQPTVASDIISIVLTGPMYPKQQTLTLVDLPGLVQGRHNAMTESSAVSNDILNLLHPYLTNPHCLLLTVLPANVDYHNAHALKLASQHDPDCRRTCIVWTKPDLIDPGAESTVVEWIQQAPRVFNCRHVHMVKCRGQKAASMNESLQASLEDEQHYFATTLPWKDMDASYLGTIQLRQKLCHLQAQLVQQYMPQVLTELKMQHDQTLKQLQDLGGHRPLETAAERRQYYQITCQRLVSHLQTSLSGKGSESSKPATSSLATTTLPSFFSSSLSLHSTPSSNSSGGGIGGPNSIANQQFVPPPPPPPPPPRKVMASSWTNSSSLPPSLVAPHPSTASNTNSLGDETNSNNNTTTVAASRLHEACGVFTNQIKQGSLATVRTIVEGAQVLVTSAQGTVRGEVVHLDEDAGYCCVDSYHNHTNNAIMDDCTRRILFEFTGQVLDQQQPRRRRQQQGGRRRRNSGASAASLNDDAHDDDDDDDQTPRMEENDVWSDGKRVLIARAGGHSYDALRKIPLDCVWTDPTSWLQSQISQFRTDDLPCFLNVESFAHIVQQFMHHDWTPACYTLLDECKTILQSAMSQALEKAIHCSSTSMTTATTRTTTTATTSNTTNTMFWNSPDEPPPRYPGLRQLLHRHLRHVAESLLNDATLQVESHLAMEAHPFTQDDALFAQMNQARYSRLKRELEVALLAELEQPATTGAVDAGSPYRVGVEPTHSAMMNASDVSTTNGTRDNLRTAVTNNNMEALPGILDNVFARHENLSMNEHLAFEMELALESYGVIATRRVLDRTPMICWHVYRTFASLLSTQLASVTDADLTAALAEKPELAEQFQTLQDKCDKLKESIQLLENF